MQELGSTRVCCWSDPARPGRAEPAKAVPKLRHKSECQSQLPGNEKAAQDSEDNSGHLACAVQSMETPGHVQQIISRCRFHRDPGGIGTQRLPLHRQQKSTSKALFHSSIPLHFVLETECEAGIVMLQSCAEVIWGVVFISFTANSGRLFQGRITLELK